MTHTEFIGEDGASHQVTENLGFWLGLYNISHVGIPADKVQGVRQIGETMDIGGIRYERLGRPKVPTLYTEETLPAYGKAHVLREGASDGPVIFTCGQEVWESLVAAEMLSQDKVEATVVNVSYLKPFDGETINCEAAGRHVFVTEVHNPAVGLASVVSMGLMKGAIPIMGFTPMGVTGYVPSAPITTQKHMCGLLGEQIYERVKETVR